MKAKGTNSERELIHLLWKEGFASIRCAGSGSSRYPTPDILAGNGKTIVSIEAKSRAKLPVYLTKEEIDDLIKFSEQFGSIPLVAVRIKREQWKLFRIYMLNETDKGYSVTKENYGSGFSISELFRLKFK